MVGFIKKNNNTWMGLSQILLSQLSLSKEEFHIEHCLPAWGKDGEFVIIHFKLAKPKRTTRTIFIFHSGIKVRILRLTIKLGSIHIY